MMIANKIALVLSIIGSLNWGLVGLFGFDLVAFIHRKRASPRGEAGTSGFLSVSDSDRRVPAELGQESQASSCVEEWNSA